MKITQTLPLLALCAGAGFALTAAPVRADVPSFAAADYGMSQTLYRKGADDGANHDANDDRGRGRGRGRDDGPKHTWLPASGALDGTLMARKGADDGANHDANDDRGRGRGNDDGPNHT